MRHVRAVFCAMIPVFFLMGTLAADDSEAMYDEIKKAGDTKISKGGKSSKEYRQEVVTYLEGLIGKCEQYKKRYPEGTEVNEVYYEQAKAYFYLSRFKGPRRELLDKGAEIARKTVELDAKVEAAGKARGLLIQYYRMNAKWEESLKQAQAVVRDFPKMDLAPLALLYMADAYEKLEKEDQAIAAYRKLVKDYDEHPYALRAAGILVFKELKGSAPELEFTSTKGEKVDLKKYRGKVVLVDFWASWNASCRSTASVLVRTERLLRDKGFRVIGISLDKSKDGMEAFVKEANISWPQYFDGKKWDNRIARKFGISSVPARILIDRTGKVREINLFGRELQNAISKLLDEKSS